MLESAVRAAAKRLEAEYGPELVEDVEAILHAGAADRRPDRYLDPVTVSLASLIVSVASFAWTLYKDLRKKTPKPAPEVIARRIRIEVPGAGEREGVVEVVVDEVIRSIDP